MKQRNNRQAAKTRKGNHLTLNLYIDVSEQSVYLNSENCLTNNSRVAQEVEYIRNVLSVSGTLKYADSGNA